MSSEAAPGEQAPSNRRAPLWQAFKESWAVVRSACANEKIQLRDSDIATARLMRATLVIAAILIGLSLIVWRRYMLRYIAIAQLFALVSIGLYIYIRFGVLRVLKPRHALVFWQL